MSPPRAQRLGTLDKLLLATLLPAFAIVLTIQVREGRANGVWHYRLVIGGAVDRESYPVVDRVENPASMHGLEPGDRLLRVGDFDLRGATSRGAIALASRAAGEGARAEVVAERGNRRFETWIERLPEPLWWSGIPYALATVAVAALVLLKAPQWNAARAFFVTSCAAGLAYVSGLGRLLPEAQVGAVIWVAGFSLTYGMGTSLLLRFNESALPLRPWQRALPFLVGGLVLFGLTAYRWLPPLLTGRSNRWLDQLAHLIGTFALLGALVRTYSSSDALGRRQLKWVLYGFLVALLPQVVFFSADAAGTWRYPDEFRQFFSLGIPIGFAVAILGFQLFDIDRLISATASVTVLGIGALAATLAVVPRLAQGLSSLVGLDAAVGQWALSLAAVGALVPVHRVLRPWLDRQMFADQAARMAGFEALLGELSSCGSAGELTKLGGERLDVLLEPDSIATYARAGELFTPIFVRGHAAPAAFQADSLLVKSLEARTTPLVASDEALGAFDRAALTTLGAELVVPVRLAANLAAFTCLGRKRSGDIYTATDRAVLAAVATKIGERLAQLDAEDLARDTRAMQERLRRYVPGAVAAEIESGRELAPEEREVTVLFVDLRGYTSFAEGRAAEVVFSTINEYTEGVSRVVKAHGGTVVEFNGDGMMAVFGAPEALVHKERAAVRAGREIVEEMPGGLPVGVGIATGQAMVGSIRSADRWIWSAIGNTTNLAARLQTLTREIHAAIAVDEATQAVAGYVCADFVRHAGIAIRGRSGRRTVFALPAAADDGVAAR
jgi:class 3 adenylate cyclase